MEFIISVIIAVCFFSAVHKKVNDVKNGCAYNCSECKMNGRCTK